MIWMLTCTVRSLRRTLDSMATPCSVNTMGELRAPPQLEITFFDFKFCHSFGFLNGLWREIYRHLDHVSNAAVSLMDYRV